MNRETEAAFLEPEKHRGTSKLWWCNGRLVAVPHEDGAASTAFAKTLVESLTETQT